MAFAKRKVVEAQPAEKLLDMDASMQGNLTFKDPVKLRINGYFEGSLNTKGTLTIGEGAQVKATITGDEIIIAGKVEGNVTARRLLRLISPARLIGEINTRTLIVSEGAFLHGNCRMLEDVNRDNSDLLSIEETARYLNVDADSIVEWAKSGKIPSLREGESLRFHRSKLDEWVASQK